MGIIALWHTRKHKMLTTCQRKQAYLNNQIENAINYSEANEETIIKKKINNKWKKTHEKEKEDHLGQLNRLEQVTIFRLKTRHCQLSYHLYKLKLCDTNDCLCGTVIQTIEHVLQD